MRGWQCHELTGVSGLRWDAMPAPQPGPGQVLVAIRAASLNFPDLLVIQGKYQVKLAPPFIPGVEFAGVIEAVGPGVERVSRGDRVMGFGTAGAFATHTVVSADVLWPVPAEMRFEDAAAFLLTYGTSYHALMDRAALREGETVLILGAAGGLGTAAVQIAKAAGARVIAAVSTRTKAELARSLGADMIIDYSNLREAIKSATSGRGPDVVYDPVGGDVAEPVFRSIAWGGRYLVVGFAQGGIPALPLNLTLLKGASIVGVYWGEFVRREPDTFRQGFQKLIHWYQQAKIRPVIDRIQPMSELPAALGRMGAREVRGKLVLVNDNASSR
jgi:NADPH:quinone reductase